jgi:hypothetical protein
MSLFKTSPVILLFMFSLLYPIESLAQLTGDVNFVVLRVTFPDFGPGTRFTEAQVENDFANIGTLWGNHTSYGTINLHYQFAGPYQLPSNSGTYIHSTPQGFTSSDGEALRLLTDAVANSPNTVNWAAVYGVVILFGDALNQACYRGLTPLGTSHIIPPAGGALDIHYSIVGENPCEDETFTWGRWAHEMGHEMQANPGNPWHPSNYNSYFEQMDAEYPAQSGMFNKQSNMAYPGWMPAGKYKVIMPPTGAAVGIFAEEQPPGLNPDFQAIKAFLTFGGTRVYYLISVRRRINGDELATVHGPNGIPDEGVLIERVVEGGDSAFNDCFPDNCPRWVNIIGNGGDRNRLWHQNDVYFSDSDGILIEVQRKLSDDSYFVFVEYCNPTFCSDRPADVGINSWLQAPGNTYETTDIWVDSPLNGYDTYRYGMWSDLMGGMVPMGNGDDPAVGQVNRIYARVRNYGSAPATNVVVHFDVTNPLGLGINGSNGFVELGSVDQSQFPGLALIAPGSSVDVYLEWTPQISLTPEQIAEGRFFFHSCLRVRLNHVPGETFFANQDGDGQQENIEYFQAPTGGGGSGSAQGSVIRLRNDSKIVPKEFHLNLLRDDLPSSWIVELNNGDPIVRLGPNEVRDIPLKLKQSPAEPAGSHHSARVIASNIVTLHNELDPNDVHNDPRPLGGVSVQFNVLHIPKLTCTFSSGHVRGTISGLDSTEQDAWVFIGGLKPSRKSTESDFAPGVGRLVRVGVSNGQGTFQSEPPDGAATGVCLFPGSKLSASTGSTIIAFK